MGQETRTLLFAILVFASGCFYISGDEADDRLGKIPTEDTAPAVEQDADGDGYDHTDYGGEDCNDDDPAVNPGAAEVWYDGVDQDCDGASDYDQDGDGYDHDAFGGDDCDDEDTTVHPGTSEVWYDGTDQDCDGASDYDQDADGSDSDSFGGDDCDDEEATINPGATELCDEVDNDCDGETDENDAEGAGTWYADADSDSYGDPGSPTQACEQPSGTVADNTDCDDEDAAQFPGADEYCNGEDDDCDVTVDEDDALDVATWYADTDADGYGDPAVTFSACDQPTGFVADLTDCDDGDAAQYPGADEYCNSDDDDCDGTVDEDDAVDTLTWYADADSDGYGDVDSVVQACTQPTGYVADDNDCDDSEASTYPGADEYCDGHDDDCDGTVDEDDALDADTWYLDGDGDGYGETASTTLACSQPSGYSALYGDCDDTDVAFNPGASESDCTDPEDYNCDGSSAYTDADGDGYAACEECDDSDAAKFPGADEYCNGEDDDCDGDTDEDDAVDVSTWYADSDSDGYGDPAVTAIACDQPTGFVADLTDCDDTDVAQHPGAPEYCTGEDDDCDGDVDEDDAFDVLTWYADTDGDSYGDPASTDIDCDQPSAYVADDSDCDDADAAQYPGADEYCNSEDDDCDGDIDEDDAVDATTWYADSDGDSYGDVATSDVECTQPSAYVADATDCDDTDAAINPAATEVCDDIDNDCDELTDDDDTSLDSSTGTVWYADADGDGYGDLGSTTQTCDAPSGYCTDATDCDDSDAAINPAATEVCDEADNDCDGLIDDNDSSLDASTGSTWYADDDSDGYGDASSTTLACEIVAGTTDDSTDCDDSDASINPGATETAVDGIDQDCDGGDVCYEDLDGDAYGSTSTVTSADLVCTDSGEALLSTDCDDAEVTTYPGADEYCDGHDDDCDGTVDEDDALDVSTWYADGDGDGFGDAGVASTECYVPSGYVTVTGSADTDCDDGESSVYPGASETVVDGIDQDCDGGDVCYEDGDGDGYGSTSTVASTDLDCTDSGEASVSTDCDDGEASTCPGATEYCDGHDDDCDGDVDEDDATDATAWYLDADGDGYGDVSDTVTACSAPTSYLADATDCDDSDASVYLGASEVAVDGIDQDCDGGDTCYADGDGDGYGTTSTVASTDLDCTGSGEAPVNNDCDDTDSGINPAAVEVYEDYVDEDCDGFASIFEDDFDDETHGASPSGDDGWSSSYGGSTWATSVESTYSSTYSHSGGLSLATNGGSGEIGRHQEGFEDDFALSFWMYDEGNSYLGSGYGNLIVGFGSTSETGELYGVFDVAAGWIFNSGGAYNCDEDYYCAVDNEGHVCNLGPRSVAWHEIEFYFTYTGDSDGNYTVCIDDNCTSTMEECSSFSGRYDFALDVLMFNDDGFEGYLDDFHAWYLGDSPHRQLVAGEVDSVLGGPNASERVGMSMAGLGDMDGDGYGDVIVGGSSDGGGDGSAYVVYGPVSGDLDLASADAILNGSSGERSSQYISNAGDVNDDGFNDVLVGCYSGGGVNYLVHGPLTGSQDLSSVYAARFEGVSSTWAINSSGAGDLDNDGYDDVLIAAPNTSTGGSYSGTLYLVRGPVTGSVSLASSADVSFYGAAGHSLSSSTSLGDVDGDGALEIMASGSGISGHSGTAYLLDEPTGYSGSMDITTVATASFQGEASDDLAGCSLSGGQDVDGDGYDDFLIGAYGEDGGGSTAGAVYLILGDSTGLSGSINLGEADAKFVGEGASFQTGVSVSLDGDVNGDGLADILIGACETSGTGPGRAYLFVGPVTGVKNVATADVIFRGESLGDYAGTKVEVVLDTNGDGYDDILIGASYSDAVAANGGAAYLILGSEL